MSYAPLPISRRLSVAPMMDWTDRHCRQFHRILAPRTLLYTEMVVAQAVLRGDRERLLGFTPEQGPLALQLGGCDPKALAEAARIGADWGYDEINLNVGCPSDRVKNGQFGACLMARPELVAECVAAMRAAVTVPVTVKCRIGIDDQDSEEFLHTFIDSVSASGCRTFIVHARKAILSGLSPKQNREIPPLCYPIVWRLKALRPSLQIVINGGIATDSGVDLHWQHVDGVMIGREAYHNPYFLAGLDRRAWPEGALVIPDAVEVIERLMRYIDLELKRHVRLHSITRHLAGLFAGRPGARAWRRSLGELQVRPDADARTLLQLARDVSRVCSPAVG